MTMGYLSIDLRRPGSWRDRCSTVAEWDEWDRTQRKALGWRAGLTFWTKTNVEGSRSLIARHWPHRLCWSWSVWVGRFRKGYDEGPKISLRFSRKYRQAEIWMLFWYARICWQDYDWMPDLSYKLSAPQMFWHRQLRDAEPAGNA